MSLQDTRLARAETVVLLADDDFFIRTLLKKMLPAECRFIDVAEGAQVCKAYQEHLPDIVFLDLHLPEYDGRAAVKEILAYDPYAHVVIMTADGSRENISSSVVSGAKCFLTKPLDEKRVVAEFVKSIAGKKATS